VRKDKSASLDARREATSENNRLQEELDQTRRELTEAKEDSAQKDKIIARQNDTQNETSVRESPFPRSAAGIVADRCDRPVDPNAAALFKAVRD
jgi:ElaB/YqjD/DUF883 family membrane-anchored ribosome-binding protein